MLNELKQEAALSLTQNGGLTYSTSGTDCLDLFFRAGAMRWRSAKEIRGVFLRAYAEDPLLTAKILFYARDVRGGLGERRFFRTALRAMAVNAPDHVLRNLELIPEYGRFDDLLSLLHTSCEAAAADYIRRLLTQDCDAMAQRKPASLLAKWLPSVNASAKATVAEARYLTKLLGMTEKTYRQTLSALRRYTDIVENRLRTRDYTFPYSAVPSGAMLKYRDAFSRNDAERYKAYIDAVRGGKEKIHAGTLYPYDIVRKVLGRYYADSIPMTAEEILTLDTLWNNLPAYGCTGENALAVVDGSGSMYGGSDPRPIDVALSLGIYFAEHNQGEFANHFITFSRRPQLVEIKGSNIAEKVKYCASYNDVLNTDLEAVFMLLLRTAVKHHAKPSDLPKTLYIISDMEFDGCVTGGNDRTLFETMQKTYAENGYTLPRIVFWNVNSWGNNVPVRRSQTGAALVSGASPSLFDLVMEGEISPEKLMLEILGSERYAAVQ